MRGNGLHARHSRPPGISLPGPRRANRPDEHEYPESEMRFDEEEEADMLRHDRNDSARWALIILAILLSLALAGCSDDDDDGGTEPPAPDTTPPEAVGSFQAVAGDGEVVLTWQNPTDGDFTGTVVRRYTDEAPGGPETGTSIFAGAAETWTDQSVTNDVTYTYAAYTHDQENNFGDPVVATATPHAPFVVTFPDPNLEQAIRDYSGVSSGDITDFDLRGITEINVWNGDIADLTGLEYCLDLEELILVDNPIDESSNLDVLAALPAFWHLDIQGTDLADLSALANLTGLTKLMLENPAIDDLAPLTALVDLEELSMDQLGVTDLAPLTALDDLTALAIHRCDGLTSFATIGTMTQLANLRAHDIASADLAPLSTLTGLWNLEIDGCLAHDLAPLAGLTQLTNLSLYRMPLLRDAIDVQIPALEQAGVYVGWSAMIPVELVGYWYASAVTVDGSSVDPSAFFEWEPGTASARLTGYANADYGYVELDADDEVLYAETGELFVDGDQLQVTIDTENGSDIPDYVAFAGTWQVNDESLTLTAEEEGSVVVITWER
jgi:hypothetical protein